MELHRPVIITEGGIWADHDVVCPVCSSAPAVLELSVGIFQPCWFCQEKGWRTKCMPRWIRWITDGWYK